MDRVELGRLGPLDHPFLAMAAQINVGAKVIRIAQMVDHADQRIGHVDLEVRLVRFVGIPGREHREDVIRPLLDDSLEVPIDQVGGLGAHLQAFGGAAPDRRSPQSRQRFLDFGELQSDGFDFFGGRRDRRVSGVRTFFGFRRSAASAGERYFHFIRPIVGLNFCDPSDFLINGQMPCKCPNQSLN